MADQYGREVQYEKRDAVVSSSQLDSGWYVTYGGTIMTRVKVVGDVKLVLVDGLTTKFESGINVPAGSTLTIYGQTTERDHSGKLIATGTDYNSAIGGGNGWVEEYSKAGGDGGRFHMKGGWVYAHGGSLAAAIGGGRRGNSGTIVIDVITQCHFSLLISETGGHTF